jgi:hypothetical protein
MSGEEEEEEEEEEKEEEEEEEEGAAGADQVIALGAKWRSRGSRWSRWLGRVHFLRSD